MISLKIAMEGWRHYAIPSQSLSLPSSWLECPFDGAVRNITAFLDLPHVRETLGIASQIGNFSSCSIDVGADFARNLDRLQLTKYFIEGLLERGFKVLVYVGTYDWIWFAFFSPTPLIKYSDHPPSFSNHVGNLRWTEALKWTRQKTYTQQPLRDWFVTLRNGTVEVAGKTRSANGLTFATVYAAGHMVRLIPLERPY